MISIHFTAQPVVDFDLAKKGDNDTFKRFFHAMLLEGIYLPPSAYEAFFISTAHQKKHFDKTVKAVEKALKKIA